MANNIKFEKVPGGIKVPLSEAFREIVKGYTTSTFWYHLRGVVDVARADNNFYIPGDDVETFVTVMRIYFEHNGVQELLEDETKQVDLMIYSHTTKYHLDKTVNVAGFYSLCPMSPWSLIVSDKVSECSGK